MSAMAELTTPEGARTAWDAIAPGYGEWVGPTHHWLGDEGLRRAGLEPGMRFLDVAAGTGALSLPAARLGARVLATDIAPGMLEQLARRAAAEQLAIETRVMDGHALELEDATFDLAGSQFGVMLFPDMPRGIHELARVTRPGGRVLMTVYGDPERVEFLTFFVRAIRAAVPGFPGLPTDPPPLPFQLQDTGRLASELQGSGLKDVRVETIVEGLEFRDGDELWSWLMNSNPIPRLILDQLGVTGVHESVIRQALDDAVRECAGGNGPAVLTNPIHIGVGTR